MMPVHGLEQHPERVASEPPDEGIVAKLPYLAQRGQSTDACDDALASCGRPGETVLREEASYYRIGAEQFKSPALRALEHLVSIPSRYNAAAPTFLTRNCVAVRTTARRWRCMFHAIRELTPEPRAF